MAHSATLNDTMTTTSAPALKNTGFFKRIINMFTTKKTAPLNYQLRELSPHIQRDLGLYR
ncbi:hypothetical protein L0B53_03100 [Vibrio sp. SS-MA-C1-2]|uniref:hypothetical protein n=1 Tax=Vibrio sp. SS-MA-C1-2 TaxID=2908646 RepID=UPI001F1860F8|nr:hypothetical protein [Vibrio sp. SS-MA-C1-2]UJF16944.1 hypothetical protein L0B53_03100 [Vibrio sp. SS-MA-C1-2]